MKDLFIKTDQQRQWLKKLESVKEQIVEDVEEIDRQGSFPFKGIEALKKIKYPAVTLPQQYGGEGFSIYDMILLQETLGSYDGSTALITGWSLNCIGDVFQQKIWSEDMLQHYAAQIRARPRFVNRAASEVGTGSPTRGGRPSTTAKRSGQNWIISGHKTFTTGIPVLDDILVQAFVEEEQAVGFFLISSTAPGVSWQENWDVVGMRGTSSHDLILNKVVVEDVAYVERATTPRQLKNDGYLLHIPATYLGIAQAARDYAVDFANTYQPNSLPAPIGTLPSVQEHIGQIDLKLAQARFTLYGVAELFDDVNRKGLLKNELGIAKHTVTNLAIEIVDRAMRIVGAKSLQLSNPLQRYYRDVRAGLHNPPMDDMTIKKLAEIALKERGTIYEKA
ncbi:acyl-CoA dehydrogenase family protein [Kurthia sibirica]|nr:acyl-CoA dehydrogenase family protein [Kurthia sibirica]GEK34761.1 putative acyl-CoA dehydrogenase YdbM [Kurthia sibirica]